MPVSTFPSTFADGVNRDALMRVVDPIVHAHGGELVDIEFRREQQGWVLRLFVEKQGATEKHMSIRDAAVDLELCAGISRDLSHALDVADVIPHAYHLEVSSPGVERRLRSEADFVRFAGEKAKIKLREPIVVDPSGARQRVLVGTIGAVGKAALSFVEGGKTHEIPLASIESARLVFEFGSSGKRPPAADGRDSHPRKHH
jgi:ribosome maturation factor RimP